MKKILLENALESWSVAIECCKNIKKGLGTLHYQKNFVSSLHNAIELFLKQIMIDNNDYSVAYLFKVKNESDAKLQLEYYHSKNLNGFFSSISDDDRNKFRSVEFSKLIDNSTKLIKTSLDLLNIDSIKEELKILQALRNNETHFYISKTDYLTEENFVSLHNLMIIIYNVLENYDLLPYWGEACKQYKHLEFKLDKIDSFSFSASLKSSPIAKSVKNVLSGMQLYGDPNSYSLAEQYFDECTPSNFSFNEVLSTIIMMEQYKFISYTIVVLSDEIELDDGEIIPTQTSDIINISL